MNEIAYPTCVILFTGNAVKFAEFGSVRLEATMDPSAGIGYGHFSGFRDLIGIPKDQQEHIFEAFAQADGV
jgi:signal transduction histidine kinase